MRSPFSIKWIYLIERRSFDQKYKFSNKNDMVCTCRNFKNNFSRPLYTTIFRQERLKFHPYSIFIGETMVGFAIFYVLRIPVENQMSLPNVSRNCLLIPPDKKSSSVPSSEVSFVSIYGLPIWVVTYDHFLIKDWVRHFLSLKTEK